jgi:hypothetical protein
MELKGNTNFGIKLEYLLADGNENLIITMGMVG